MMEFINAAYKVFTSLPLFLLSAVSLLYLSSSLPHMHARMQDLVFLLVCTLTHPHFIDILDLCFLVVVAFFNTL